MEPAAHRAQVQGVLGTFEATTRDPAELKQLTYDRTHQGPSVASEVERLADIPHRLRKEREFAFYGDEDFIPTEEYKREDAQKALDEARFVLSRVDAFPTEDPD